MASSGETDTGRPSVALSPGGPPAARDIRGFPAITAKEDGGIGLDAVVLLSPQQPMNGLAKVFALQIPSFASRPLTIETPMP